MKTYSMQIRDFQYHLEIQIYKGEIEHHEQFFYKNVDINRSDVPQELLELFYKFANDMQDLDWDPDYGFVGNYER